MANVDDEITKLREAWNIVQSAPPELLDILMAEEEEQIAPLKTQVLKLRYISQILKAMQG
jgi:hypothetical protein